MRRDLVADDVIELGKSSLMDVIEQLVPIEGRRLLDVGCGDGFLAKALAARGGEVTGVEPDPVQAEKNRQAEPVKGMSFAESGGENLPAEDASVSGVFFRYSLHHVPADLLAPALREAARVLEPETGFLFIAEPLLLGDLQAVYEPFHDETMVRTRAYEALKDVAAPLFRETAEYRYSEVTRFDSFEAFRDRILGLTYNDIERERVDNPTVRTLFEKGRTEEGYVFDRFNRVNLFKGPVSSAS